MAFAKAVDTLCFFHRPSQQSHIDPSQSFATRAHKHKTMSAFHTSIPAGHDMLKKIDLHETRFHGIFKAKGQLGKY